MPKKEKNPGLPPRFGVLKTEIQAIDSHHEGIIYGTITASEKKRLKGKSLLTRSHARIPPMTILKKETKHAIKSEWQSGRYSIFFEITLFNNRFQ